MRWFWEQTGALGPIYRLLGRGLDDTDIGTELGLSEVNVRNCICLDHSFLKAEGSPRAGSIRVSRGVAFLPGGKLTARRAALSP